MRPVEQPALVKAFVQHTLGCGCPETVFTSMLTEVFAPPDLPDVSIRRLLIGNRLLIYLLPADGERPLSAGRLADIAGYAQKERDTCGYNRVRLVVPSTRVAQDRVALARFFAERFGSDEKLHLHVLDRLHCPVITAAGNDS